MKTKTLWKSMRAGMLSGSGDIGPWVTGEWRKHTAPLEMCESGFHASKNIADAMGYVDCEVLAQVEVRGKHKKQDDKQVWSEMRVVRSWEWTKADSVALAIYAAELVIHIYENKYHDDKRPRQAIEAAKAWLNDPSEKNRAAAWAARAAGAAARAAAWAAGDSGAAAWAARAAGAAARAAAVAAARAAAVDAAVAAANKDILDKCHAFVVARVESK